MLLIDELDRADEAFEAFLLEVLADFQVTIPELGTVKAAQPPIVVITSNRTREIHDALKRRCLYHWVGYPSATRELEIVRAKVPGVGESCPSRSSRFVQALRKQDLFKIAGRRRDARLGDGARRARRGRARLRRRCPTRSACCSSIRTTSRGLEAARSRSCSIRCAGLRAAGRLVVAPRPEEHCEAMRRKDGAAPLRDGRLCRLALPHGRRAPEAGREARSMPEPTSDQRAVSPRTSSTSCARARPVFAGRARCSTRSPRSRRLASATRDDFYWTLHAVFVKRHEHSVLFDQAFRIFFRRRGYLDQLLRR